MLQAWLCPSWGCDFEHCCLPGFVSPASVKWRLGHMLFTALPGSTLKKHYSFLHAAEAWLPAHESAFYRKAVVWVPMLDTSEEKVHCKGASENKPLEAGMRACKVQDLSHCSARLLTPHDLVFLALTLPFYLTYFCILVPSNDLKGCYHFILVFLSMFSLLF